MYALFGNSSLAGIFRGRNTRNVSKMKSIVIHFAHADTCVIIILNNSRVFKNVIFKKLISTYVTCRETYFNVAEKICFYSKMLRISKIKNVLN